MSDQNSNERELMEIIDVFIRRNNELYMETRQLQAENRLLRNANRNLVITGQKMARELRQAKGGQCAACNAVAKDFVVFQNISNMES